jgi:hypothetical protein
MKLSEAIRLGAMLKPHTKDELLHNGSSCAVGAALDAIGELKGNTEREYQVAKETWPLLELVVSHPLHYEGEPAALMSVIWTLNDSNGSTREAIADWVETVERAQDAAAGGNQAAMEPANTTSASAAK